MCTLNRWRWPPGGMRGRGACSALPRVRREDPSTRGGDRSICSYWWKDTARISGCSSPSVPRRPEDTQVVATTRGRVRDERRPARTSGPRALVGLAWGRVCKSARVSTCCLPLKGRSFVVRLNGIFLERPELVCIVGTLFHMYKQRHQPETKITTNHFRRRDEKSRK